MCIVSRSMFSNTGASLPIATQVSSLRAQYPATVGKAFQVTVAPGWSIHVEETGNPDGIPVVFVHGGPGICYRDTDRQWFDPERYRIITFQQRGTNKCTPSAYDTNTSSQVFKDVTIQTLVEDMEVLREHLNIDKWLVFGGSWGSTLSTFYAQERSQSCLGVVLRGVFLATHKENALFFNRERHERQCGDRWRPEVLDRIISYAASKGFSISFDNMPDIYQAYRILCVERDDRIAQRIWHGFEEFVDDPTEGNFEMVMSDDLETTGESRSIGIWETQMMDLVARNYNLLDPSRLQKLQGLPIQIVQGANDNLCHHSIAQELYDGLKGAGAKVKYTLVPGGGHSPYSTPGMIDALISATDTFAENREF